MFEEAANVVVGVFMRVVGAEVAMCGGVNVVEVGGVEVKEVDGVDVEEIGGVEVEEVGGVGVVVLRNSWLAAEVL